MGRLIDADRASRHSAKGVDRSVNAAYREWHRRRGLPDPTGMDMVH